MGLPIISTIGSLVLTLIVIGIGYLSLFFGYVIAKKPKDFFMDKLLKPTDKIIISFLIGGFSFLILTAQFPELVAEEITDIKIDNIVKILIFVLMLISIFSLSISNMVQNKELKP
ncbi:MAG: hypothetical protein KAT91_02225 [Candidatus Aenigmarchaeota archaeon]|nr:hypothetical protein [Candidatus Aenigmarchaeota archaeon]